MKELEKMGEIISDILDYKITVDYNTALNEIEGWGSLEQMTFILLLENEFNLTINIDEFDSTITLKEICNLISNFNNSQDINHN